MYLILEIKEEDRKKNIYYIEVVVKKELGEILCQKFLFNCSLKRINNKTIKKNEIEKLYVLKNGEKYISKLDFKSFFKLNHFININKLKKYLKGEIKELHEVYDFYI